MRLTPLLRSAQRKKEIYSIASKHDLVILEDDPYYYLNFNETLPPSFFSADIDGRVIRFDSMSKIISAGLRVGFATGPPELIERMELHHQATLLHASGVSQAIVAKLFDEFGGVSGFLTHCESVTKFYKHRRDVFMTAVKTHLAGLVVMKPPSAGMFAWMRVLNIDDSAELVMNKSVGKNVLMVPGESFIPTSGKSAFVRCSYSTASEEEIDTALKRFGDLLRE
tara:strand:+ start:139 stop:810 length:672 start_codon:yes stop_codon:yes gene_type:complete